VRQILTERGIGDLTIGTEAAARDDPQIRI